MTGIYPVREDLRSRRKIVRESELPEESKRVILEYVDARAADGMSPHRESFYLTYLKQIAMIMGPAFTKPTRKDVEHMLAVVESRDYEAWTKYSYRTATKRFYKWLLGNDEEYPPEVKWVKVSMNGTHRKMPKDLLTTEEVQALVKACLNERDRALISLLVDSGCRIGEILTERIGDVVFDKYGLVLSVTGKTGPRRVRVVGDSIAYTAAWLEVHPSAKDRNAPLFVGVTGPTSRRAMTYAMAHKVIAMAAARAGIAKRVHPHLFRHMAATLLASKVPEAPLEEQMGWVPGSAMARTYVHLSGRDVDRAILKAHGIELEDEKSKEERMKICPRCQVPNASVMKFCRRCGLPLDVEIAIALEDKKQQDLDVNPALEAMRRDVLRLERELEQLARGSGGRGKSVAQGA